MELKREVSGDGPLGEILIIGEAPGAEEVAQGKPFVGPSGKLLRHYCAERGLLKVRYENVVEYKLSGNDERVLYYDKNRTLPSPELKLWWKDLHKRIKLIDPKVIVACGDTALKATTDYTSISAVHCYVLRDGLDVDAPVIPAYHPAYILRQRSRGYWLKWALEKAKAVAGGKTDPPMKLITNNDFQQAMTFLESCLHSPEVCIDIETLKDANTITAIGISMGPDTALSVSQAGMAPTQWASIIAQTKRIMEAPEVRKIGQNFMFDALVLWRVYGIDLKGPVWDTMHAANCLNSDLRKSLEELGRLYFYGPPWKGGWNTTGEALRRYNAKDVIATHRIKAFQFAEMQALDGGKYFKTPQSLFGPAFELCKRGIRVDIDLKNSMTAEVEAALKPIYERVCAWAAPYVPKRLAKKTKRDPERDILVASPELTTGKLKRADLDEYLHVRLGVPKKECKEYFVPKDKLGHLYKKSYRKEIELQAQSFNPKSSKQVMGVLQNAGVKIPKVKQSHTKKWEESTNEKALKKILERNKDSEEILDFIRDMLVLRHGYKLISSYCKASLDSDNRWRCAYNIEGTETGRSSTKKTPWGTGGNNQNFPRDDFQGVKFKKVFIPDKEMTLLQLDQSQAEARVVAHLANCKKLIELFGANEDIHVYAINNILGEDIRETPDKYKYLRQVGKFINHGGNYDMGPATLSEEALKQGVTIPVTQAKYFLERRRAVFPEIYEWHKSIQQKLHKDRTLWTPFGRRRVFMGLLSSHVYREAYAHIPQSTIPHITNLMWLWVTQQKALAPSVQVLQMGHDSLLMQVLDDKLDDFILAFLRATREITFTINDSLISIPWDVVAGSNWGELAKWG